MKGLRMMIAVLVLLATGALLSACEDEEEVCADYVSACWGDWAYCTPRCNSEANAQDCRCQCSHTFDDCMEAGGCSGHCQKGDDCYLARSSNVCNW